MIRPLAILVVVLFATVSCGTDPDALPVMEFSPPVHDFGAASLGLSSDSLELTLRNNTDEPTGPLSIGLSGTGPAAFSVTRDGCSGRRLSRRGTCTLEVRMVSAAAGTREAVLTAELPGGVTVTSLLRGSGRDDGLRFAAERLDFPDAPVGTGNRTLTVVARNAAGVRTGTIATSLTGAAMGGVSIARDACTGRALSLNEACEVDLQLSGTTAGVHEATLSVTGAPGGSASTRVVGSNGAAMPLAISPDTWGFNLQRVDVPGDSTSFTITNSGSGTSGRLRIGFTGLHPTDFVVGTDGCSNRVLAPAEGCTFILNFIARSRGARFATLEVSDGFGSRVTAPLSGAAGTVTFTLTPVLLSFSPQIVGGVAESLAVLRNTGTLTSGPIGALKVCGAGTPVGQCAPNFEFVTECGPVPPGGTCTIRAHFAPTAPGPQEVLVAVGDGWSSVVTTSSGLGSGLVALGLVNFPPSPSGQTGLTLTLTVTNSAPQPSSIVATRLFGDEFVILSDACNGAVLPAGGSCGISLQPIPRVQAGPFAGELRVSASRGGMVVTQLRGSVAP